MSWNNNGGDLLCLLALVAFTAGKDVKLTVEGKLVSANLPAQTQERLVSDQFDRPSANFYIPQCHSKQHNFTLAESTDLPFIAHENGSSVGDVIIGGVSPNLTVFNTNNNSNFDIYCTYTQYTQSAPMPGGCNLEYNFENDPNIHTWYDGFQLWIQFQYSGVSDLKCDDSKNWSRLLYTVYVLHFEGGHDSLDTVFADNLADFVLHSDIKREGTKLLDHMQTEGSKPALILTSYPDQPVFIGLVVVDTLRDLEAAYVSTVSYGCDINKDTPGHVCQVQWYFYILAGLIGVLGLFLTFLGHRFFQAGLYIIGSLSGLLIAFILLLIAKASIAALLAGSVGISLVTGLLWLLVWHAAGVPTLSLILTAANTGFLIASIVFYTPLANVSIFKNSWEIWILYGVFMAAVLLLMILWNKKINQACLAFLGSYAFTAAVSLYTEASLHHIILEPIRRATVESYYNAVFTAPFSATDIGLLVVWIALALIGYLVQFYTERGKPDFPMSPRKRRINRRVAEQLEEQERLLNPPGGAANDSNLTQGSSPYYGSITPSPRSIPTA